MYRACREVTASGLPCAAPASRDGRCIAHRRLLAARAEEPAPSPSLGDDRPGTLPRRAEDRP